jgi:hypothetical protein
MKFFIFPGVTDRLNDCISVFPIAGRPDSLGIEVDDSGWAGALRGQNEEWDENRRLSSNKIGT